LSLRLRKKEYVKGREKAREEKVESRFSGRSETSRRTLESELLGVLSYLKDGKARVERTKCANSIGSGKKVNAIVRGDNVAAKPA